MFSRLVRPRFLQLSPCTLPKASVASQAVFNSGSSFQRPMTENVNTICRPDAVEATPLSIYDFHLGVDGELTIYDLHMGVDRELLSLVGDMPPASAVATNAGEWKNGVTPESHRLTLLEQMHSLLDLRDKVDAQIEDIDKRIRELQVEEEVSERPPGRLDLDQGR